jgi:LmbE family N-acetylglucosaminyl deacetylase
VQFHHSTAEVFVPDRRPLKPALTRITHLGIGAHQDDLEFMAFHGIVTCHNHQRKWFGGVTCTNGSGSARTGRFKNYTDAQMMAVRRREQNRAATLGQYGAMIQLDHRSSDLKQPAFTALKDDLVQILAATRPEVVYTHNLADKHATHIAVATAAIQALRELPRSRRPKQVIGCEVWRSLDWLPDAEKVVMDVTGHDRLANQLNRVFASQIAGGKRYDRATTGRRAANATFFQSHATDHASQVIFGLDLTPLIQDDTLSLRTFIANAINRFAQEVVGNLK